MTEGVKVDEEIRTLISDYATKVDTLIMLTVSMADGLYKGNLYEAALQQFTEAANDVRFAYEALIERAPKPKEKLH